MVGPRSGIRSSLGLRHYFGFAPMKVHSRGKGGAATVVFSINGICQDVGYGRTRNGVAISQKPVGSSAWSQCPHASRVFMRAFGNFERMTSRS